jgi:hypothetical protein
MDKSSIVLVGINYVLGVVFILLGTWWGLLQFIVGTFILLSSISYEKARKRRYEEWKLLRKKWEEMMGDNE